MGKPAARVGDNHICPKTTSKVPHVGGPVAQGSPNVFINGLPAARKGDKVVCIGPPDSIAAGSSSVLINGIPAARLGDKTSHNGVIIGGSANVLIGDQTVNVARSSSQATEAGESAFQEPANWIDLEYLYSDGTGVAGANYTITTPEGEELATGTLNASGTARVDLPSGIINVEVAYDNDPDKDEVLKESHPKIQQPNQDESWLNGTAKSICEGANWVWGVLKGDFNENPSVSQIIGNTILTMIPVVDQVADVRDIVACLKMLVWDKRYKEAFVWFTLVITVIGLIPIVGSALKGIFKLIYKGARVSELLQVFNYFMKGNGIKWLRKLYNGGITDYMQQAATIANDVFAAVATTIRKIQDKLPSFITDTHKKMADTLETLHHVKGMINNQFAQIGNQLTERLGKILGQPSTPHPATARSTYSYRQTKALREDAWFNPEGYAYSHHPGLHNKIDGREIESKDFKPDKVVDMKKLTPEEIELDKKLESIGWEKEWKRQEIMESGSGFSTRIAQPGERLYGFNSLSHHNKKIETNSAYWMDETELRHVQDRFYHEGKWDKEGVKDYLALPCFNRVEVMDVAEITEPTVLVQSKINSASELLHYTENGIPVTEVMNKHLSGGGMQIHPDLRKMKAIMDP